jgi:hypothetical protein
MYILQYSFEIPHLIFKFKDGALFFLYIVSYQNCNMQNKKFTFLSKKNVLELSKPHAEKRLEEECLFYHVWSSYIKEVAAFRRDLVKYDMH